MLPTHHTEVRLTRQELEAMIRPALNETLVALRRAVASAGVEPGELSAVLLVGGSSRIPLVGQLVTAELGRPIAIDARPKDAISLGAALLAARAATAASVAAPPRAVPPPPPAAPPTPAPVIPPTYPPAVAATSAGRAGAGAGRSRALLLLVAAGLIAVAGLAALLLTRDRGEEAADDPGGRSETTGSPDTTADPTTTSDPGSSTTTTDGGSTQNPRDPMPGTDWSDEARTQFVPDCEPIMTSGAIAVDDPTAACGCVYDELAATADFATFNPMWAADDIPFGSPEGDAFQTALMRCTGVGIG
jgi:hypothetical protein